VSAATRYAACGITIVGLANLLLWPWLDPSARSGVLVAGVVALSVQTVAFALLLRYRGALTGFLAVWAGGTLVRMSVLAVVAVFVVRGGGGGGASMLLALAGFFFGLLLLEPLFFRPGAPDTP